LPRERADRRDGLAQKQRRGFPRVKEYERRPVVDPREGNIKNPGAAAPPYPELIGGRERKKKKMSSESTAEDFP